MGAGLFAAALLFKESALALVGIFPFLELGRRKPAEGVRGRALRWGLPVVAVLIGYLALRTAVLGGIGRSAGEISPLDNIIAHPEYGLDPDGSRTLARWGTPLAVFGQSCRLLVWPWPLSWDYSYAAIENVHHWSEPRLWAGAAILAGCLAGMVVSWRRRRVVFAAVGLALVSYFIVSNTLMLIGAVFAERYLYLPSAGFCMLVGCAVAAVARRGTKSESASVAGRRRRFACLVAAMLGLVIVAGGAATMARNRDFVSNAVLDAADVRTQPRSARLWTATAVDALNGGDRRLALERASQALAICPLDMRAWRVSARAHWELKENAAALECANKVFEAVGFTDAALVVVAGDIYQAQGDYARAIAILESFASGSGGREGPTRGEPVLDLGPQTATAYNNLAWYLLVAQPPELRDPQRALRYAERAVAIKPAAGDFLDTYVSVLQALGRVEDARRVLDAALPMIPASDQFRDGLLRKRQEL